MSVPTTQKALRVLLVMPRLPQRLGSPYLGQQYVAAALLAAGHEVRCLDFAAVRWDLLTRAPDEDELADAVTRWGPDIVGMTLFTNNARRGYLLAARLRALGRATPLLVAGGPHPTVCPEEPLRHGFDVAVSGEGERAICAIADALVTKSDLAELPGARQGPDGVVVAAGTIDDLDGLALPLNSYDCYDPSWYAEGALVVPGGLMTSRGCPARCTFCANYVTGRAYRWRSADHVISELLALRRRHEVRHFPFWDDAFTARPRRVHEVCDAILAEPELRGSTWTCITPGNMVRPPELKRMREAGCVTINFGLESGDLDVLQAIRKGIRPERVREAVREARAAGMQTVVNFMFGFPGETEVQLQHTLDLMAALADDVDFFNNRGVLVPFPGTDIYDRWHATYGFTAWWLDPARTPDEPNLHALDAAAVQAHLEEDPTLALDFFRYTSAVRDKIAECVRAKAQHNQRTLGRWSRGTMR